MLWVNLIMDTLGALALATEPPPDSILERQPYAKDNAIVTPVMWRNVFGHGIYQIAVLCVLIFLGPGWFCEVYWIACNKHAGDDPEAACEEYNPFYAAELYENDETVAYWQNKNAKVGFKDSHFNAK
jgi:magnesium-transporting ATPase (P-type)